MNFHAMRTKIRQILSKKLRNSHPKLTMFTKFPSSTCLSLLAAVLALGVCYEKAQLDKWNALLFLSISSRYMWHQMLPAQIPHSPPRRPECRPGRHSCIHEASSFTRNDWLTVQISSSMSVGIHALYVRRLLVESYSTSRNVHNRYKMPVQMTTWIRMLSPDIPAIH